MSGTRKTNTTALRGKDKLGSELTSPACTETNDYSSSNSMQSTKQIDITAIEEESAGRREHGQP